MTDKQLPKQEKAEQLYHHQTSIIRNGKVFFKKKEKDMNNKMAINLSINNYFKCK